MGWWDSMISVFAKKPNKKKNHVISIPSGRGLFAGRNQELISSSGSRNLTVSIPPKSLRASGADLAQDLMVTIRQSAKIAAAGHVATVSIHDGNAPTVPSGLTATAISSSVINLAWNASTDAVGLVQSGVQTYRVRRNGSFLVDVSSPSLTYSNTGLASSTAFSYTVQALDVAGNASAQSGSQSATTHASGGNPFAHPDVVWSSEASDLIEREGAQWAGSTNATNIITSMQGGFTSVKSEQIETGQGSGSLGWIYTADPTSFSWSNFNPAFRSQYVYVFEARPSFSAAIKQTDFYVARGTPTGLDSTCLPYDHWFQCVTSLEKLLDNAPGAPAPDRMKFVYPCRDGHGSCHTAGNIMAYAGGSGVNQNLSGSTSTGYYLQCHAENWPSDGNTNVIANTFSTGGNPTQQFGPDNSSGRILWQEWVYIKWHSYPGELAPQGGRYQNFEMWMRRVGGPWVKVMNYIGNETITFGTNTQPFEWRYIDLQRGHNMVRIPTTIGHANSNPQHDMKMYVADFVVATSEAGLPVYSL